MQVRPAVTDDLDAVSAFDQFKVVDAKVIADGRCHVAVRDDRVAGYAMVHRHFFRRPFVEFLVVHPEHRRRGVCGALLDWAESWANADRLWISTGQDNATMQQVLVRRGYRQAGLVADMFAVPELIYSKVIGGE